MKFNKLLMCLSIATSIFVTNVTSPVVAQSVNTQVREASDTDVQWTNDDFGDYYKEVFNSSSSTLSSRLSSLITSTHTTYTSYNGLLNVFNQADIDPNNSSNILCFYTGTSVKKLNDFGSGVNREHVWPKDGGDAFPEKSGPGSDGHHLRPTCTNLNSTRGSLNFGEVPQTPSNIVAEFGKTNYGSTADELCYKYDGKFYPAKGYRGQTARIIFYMASRWGGQYNLQIVKGSGSCKTIGDLPTLLKWNLEEPVSATELYRNEVVADIQGNRNPFIDNPHFACAIFGSNYDVCKDCKSVVNPYNGNVVLPDTPSSGGTGTDSGNSGSGSDTGTTTPINYGSASSPLSIAQVKTICDGLSSGSYSAQKGYVTGVVKTEPTLNSHGSYEFYLDGGNTEFMVYSAKLANGISVPKIGDTIVVNGYFKIHNGIYEVAYISALNDSPYIISVNASGTTTPDPTPTPNPDTPSGGGNTSTVTSEVSFNFLDAGIANTSYAKEKTVIIDGKNYYFSDIFVGDSNGTFVVRLGNSTTSSAINDLGLSGNGSYFRPEFNISNCVSVSLEVKNIYSKTDAYKILFQEANSSSYTTVKEGTLSGPTTLQASLTTPKTGRFIIVITGSKARADLGEFTISSASNSSGSGSTDTPSTTVDLSSINLNASCTSTTEKSYIKFAAEIDKSKLSSATKVGILVFSKNQLGSKEVKQLYTSGNLSSFKSSISKYDYLDFDFTSSKVESNDKTYFTAVITNAKGHEDYKFVAVAYAEINGKVYFTSQITKSYNDCK